MKFTAGGFDILRKNFGALNQSQVNGINFIVSELDKAGFSYPETAYALATAWHETDRKMTPIVEYGSDKYLSKYDTGVLAKKLGNTPQADGDGQKYKGRGYVQITGKANYQKFSGLLKQPLLEKPDLATNPEIAIQIMALGMKHGYFTGLGFRNKRPVGKYNRDSYIQARAIINGRDKAEQIADYAMIFEQSLRSY